MLYIAENLKRLRKERHMTQENVADALGISTQSVSKWEREESYPDITLLPALANLYQTSVDTILGMEQINDKCQRDCIFRKSHEQMAAGAYENACVMPVSYTHLMCIRDSLYTVRCLPGKTAQQSGQKLFRYETAGSPSCIQNPL